MPFALSAPISLWRFIFTYFCMVTLMSIALGHLIDCICRFDRIVLDWFSFASYKFWKNFDYHWNNIFYFLFLFGPRSNIGWIFGFTLFATKYIATVWLFLITDRGTAWTILFNLYIVQMQYMALGFHSTVEFCVTESALKCLWVLIHVLAAFRPSLI